jgi:WD40 repeat protein
MLRIAPKSLASLRSLFACLLVIPWVLTQKPQSEGQQPSRPALPLRGVLTRQPLHPAIRGRKVRLQFSPDGKYLLLQSESGLFLFSVQPLRPVLHIDAGYLYPVRFSPDSQTLSGVSFALRTVRWHVPDGKVISIGELQVPDGCIAGDVSPDGQLFVCHRVDLSVHGYDLNSRSEVFGEEPRFRITPSVVVPSALPPNNVYAASLGLVSVRSLQIFANEGRYPDKFFFSPDGTLFALASPNDLAIWNLSSKRRISVPGALGKFTDAGLCFLDSARVLLTGVPQHAEIVSLVSGKVVSKLNFEASAATLASNGGYLVFTATEAGAGRLYDIKADRVLDLPDNIAVDLRDEVLALFDSTGELHLSHLGEPAPFASAIVPLEDSPARFSVATSPGLDLLAFGFGLQTGLYRVATGQRIVAIGRSSAETIPNRDFAYFLRPTEDRKAMDVVQADAAGASLDSWWKTEATFIRGTPAVFFEYQLLGPKQQVPEVLPDGKIPFQLTAREPQERDILWQKSFISSHPVPFVDSQGKNLVLAWEGGTEAARSAAKRCPQAWKLFQKVKPTRNDTFFEVLDSVSGRTLGGVLVRTGSGPLSFDSVAAVGSVLIIAKAEGRITLYSLDDGEIKARLNGTLPAANAQSQLLSLAENDTHLGVYDLHSGKKVDLQNVGQPITYVHFSEDGTRLLVLTRSQIVYVLDVSDAAKSIRKEQ